MPFDRPTLAQLDERIRNDITGHVRMSGTNRAAPLLRRSVVGVRSRVYAGACNGLYGYLDWLADQRFVHKMEDEFLDAEGATYGMPRNGEDFASGWVLAAGSDGTQVRAERLFKHDDGATYRVTAAATVEGGAVRLHLEATEPGTAANLKPGSTLRPVQPIDGIYDNAVVDEDGITGGLDRESNDSYRARILTRKQQPPHGGASFDYVVWAKEVPGVTRAWCLPLWMGLGTVGVMFMRDGDPDPFPNEERCQEVWAHIHKARPVTVEVFVFPPVPQRIDIATKVFPDTDEIRAAVVNELDDFLFREGKPEEVDPEAGSWLYISRLSEAVSIAVGEHHHYPIDPVNDIHIPANALPYLGNVVFTDHT